MLTRPLSRYIYNQHPETFKDSEQVRTLVRNYRGAQGTSSFKDTSLHREKRDMKEWMKLVYLPSEAKERKPFIIPKSHKKTLLISDIHIPYHDLEALMLALNDGIEEGVDSIIIDGDLIDFHRISRFDAEPNSRSVKYELDLTQEFFDLLRELFPTQAIYYKLGNHEYRWESFFKTKALEMFGDEYFTLKERLNLDQWSIELIEHMTLIKYGKLNILHGHEFGNAFFSPVNPARGLFLRAKSSTIAGHNHQTSEHHENNINGDSIACWSIGCLCELSPDYRPFAFSKWNHGFAILSKTEDGNFSVKNKRIIKGKVY